MNPRLLVWSLASLAAVIPCLDRPAGAEPPAANLAPERVALATARDRARMLHEVYTATLDTMHHRYFHPERAVLPARAMEDIFTSMKEKTSAEARWISVNLKAMSVDHEPKTAFERKAAEQIASGKAAYEEVEDGTYRRATPIPLAGGCVGCHGGLFQKQTSTPKFAGLVISIPVLDEKNTNPGGAK